MKLTMLRTVDSGKKPAKWCTAVWDKLNLISTKHQLERNIVRLDRAKNKSIVLSTALQSYCPRGSEKGNYSIFLTHCSFLLHSLCAIPTSKSSVPCQMIVCVQTNHERADRFQYMRQETQQ